MLYFTYSQILPVLGFNYFRTLKKKNHKNKVLPHFSQVELNSQQHHHYHIIVDLSSGWKMEDGREHL